MGEVFAAVRTGPGGFRRAVALKRLADDDSVRGAAVQRFLAEARILSGLHHPNVVEIYDVVAANHGYVLVMELLTGATLGALARDAALPVDEVCAIADQALAGLAYIHAARDEAGPPLGLVHRDLTPNNLFVTEAGEVKLIDFGLAKLREALDAPLTREGEIHGTLELIAPEQARGELADPRTDLYQLAGSLYWALAGKYPHGSGTTAELITRAATIAPTPLATLRPDLPSALTAAIDRAMASERDARFADANAMRAALRDVLPAAGEACLAARVRAVVNQARPARPPTAETAAEPAPRARPPTATTAPDRRPARSPRRRRRWWLVVAGGAALAAGGGAIAWRTTGERAAAPTDAMPAVPVVPGITGAISATPLDDHRVAVATASAVETMDEHGGDRRAIALPPASVPVDVQAITGGRVAVTIQIADGGLRTFLDDAPAKIVVWRSRGSVMAMRPDGSQAIDAAPWRSAWVTGGSDIETVRVRAGKDRVSALAWSPDGRRVAAIHEVLDGDPVLELVDLAGAAGSKTSHAPFGGDLAAFGWLDAGHLAFAIDRDDGATVYEREVASQRERELARLPGERVIAGHTASGAIALLHGPPTYALRLATTHELAAGLDAAVAVAGLDAQGRIVFSRPDGAVVARGRDGTAAAWPGAQPRDVPLAMIDGDLLVSRDRVLHRLGATTARLVRITAPRGTAVVRCAADATAPCVIAMTETLGVTYYMYTPQSGAVPTGFVTAMPGLDHAVHQGGELLAIVDGTEQIRIYDMAHHTSRYRKAGAGAACERVAWVGDELVVAVRNWNQHAWALVAIDESNEARMIAESHTRVSAELRAAGADLAVATADVTPVLSVVRPH